MSLPIYIIAAVSFLDLLAVGLVVPLLSNHVRSMGASHIYIGLLGSIYAGFQLFSGPFIGSLSDLKGRKTILIFTLLVCSTAYVSIGFTTSVLVILIIRAILGLFKQTQLLTRALVPDYERNEQKQSKTYGRMAAISGIGITVGPLIGGHIVEDYPDNGFKILSTLVGVCFFINAALVYCLPRATVKKKNTSIKNRRVQGNVNILQQSMASSVKQSVIELFYIDWSKYYDVFIFKGLVGFAMSTYYSNYALYLKSQYELTPKYIGYVISFQGVIGSLSCYCMGFINSFYLTDSDYSQRNMHVFLLLSLSLLGIILSFNVYIYVFWLIPLAIANAVGRLVTLEMVLKRGHGEHRGTLIGASNSVRSLTGVVSPMVAGFVAQTFGVKYVVYATLASTILGLCLSIVYKNKTKVE